MPSTPASADRIDGAALPAGPLTDGDSPGAHASGGALTHAVASHDGAPGRHDRQASAGSVAPAVSARPLFRDTAVLGWALARGVSDIGDAVAFVAIAYAAARLGSPAIAGLVLAAAATPRAVFMLIGGAITDRVDTRRLMIGTDLARVAVLAAALAAIAIWGVSAPLLIAIGVPFGIADAFYAPASSTFPRQLVATTELAPTGWGPAADDTSRHDRRRPARPCPGCFPRPWRGVGRRRVVIPRHRRRPRRRTATVAHGAIDGTIDSR